MSRKITQNIFVIDNDHQLEKKAWYRFVRVINIFVYLLVIGITCLCFYEIQSVTTTNTTLICKDGTKWNNVDNNGEKLYPESQCGLCTRRLANGSYNTCPWNDPNYYDSYHTVDNTTPTYSARYDIGVSAIVLIVGLSIIKIIINVSVYIFGGRKEEYS